MGNCETGVLITPGHESGHWKWPLPIASRRRCKHPVQKECPQGNWRGTFNWSWQIEQFNVRTLRSSSLKK
jgi:hypothetical protein